MKMCGVAAAIMWSFSMEGNPKNDVFVIAVSMYPWSLVSPGILLLLLLLLLSFIFCFVSFFFSFVYFVCFPASHLIFCYKVM